MKVIGEFTENSRRQPLLADGRPYVATWESEPGFVEVPGLTEFRVRVDDEAGNAVLYMRWLLADIRLAGGKDGVLEALECHSPEGGDWAACMKRNREHCPPSVMAAGAIALLALIASPPAYKGRKLGTPLARAFAEAVLAPRGVRAFWIKPVPLTEHAATGFFKPPHEPDSIAFHQARERLEKHYERSLDAEWTCSDYLRVDLVPPEKD